MEFYDKAFTQQLAPFVAVVLELSHGLDIFQRHLDNASITNKTWDDVVIKNRLLKAKYCFRYYEDTRSILKTISLHTNISKEQGVHSQLSPFNVNSDLFPNGILSSKWLHKYVFDFPAVVVCSHELSDDPTADESLGLLLTSQREQFDAFGIKYIAIVVSDLDDSASIDRVAQLRQVSGLPKSSRLFHISRTSEASNYPVFERDCETLASTIISTLKSICTDFYSDIEHKVEQRHQKYYKVPRSEEVETQIQLTPAFLEVRNCIKKGMLIQLIHPHSIEGSLPILEQAYTGLLQLMEQNLNTFTSATISAHDERLFIEWRTLLDMLALHVIRGYFSIEEPVAALRKHEAHTLNLNSFFIDEQQTKIWRAIQYHWLADLMSLIPQSVLNDLYNVTSKKPNSKRSMFFGGMAFHDTFGSSIVTTPSSIYVKAASLLSNLGPVNDTFFPTTESLREYRIKLLRAARSLLDEKHYSLARVKNLIDWQIADELMQIGDYKGAEEGYSNVLDYLKGISKYLRLNLLKRRIELFKKMKDTDNLAKSVVEGAIEDPTSSCSDYVQDLQGNISVKPALSKILTIEALIFFENPINDYVLCPVVHQLKVTAKPWIASQTIGGLKLELFEIRRMRVVFSEDSILTFPGDGTQSSRIQTVDSDFNSSWLKTGDLVLKFLECPKRSGWHEISRIDAEMTFRLSIGDVHYNCEHIETHKFDEPNFQDSILVYDQDASGRFVSRAKLLHGRQSNRIFIKPYKPDLNFKCVSPYSSAILDEKLTLPVEFSRTVFPDAHLVFKEVHVEVKSRVLQDAQDSFHYVVQHNWSRLKDDEPLDLLEFLYSSEKQTSMVLHASVKRTSTEITKHERNLMAVLEFLVVVTEHSGTVSSYELAQVELNVLSLPLDTKFSISPRYSETPHLMPNPFVLSMTHNDYSMPQPSRLWLLTMSRLDSHQLIAKGEIVIGEVKFDTKTQSLEIDVAPHDNVVYHDEKYKQSFIVQSKAHVTQNNVSLTVQGSISWKRPNSETMYIFNTAEMDFALQVHEPRVLLNIDRLESNTMKLEYILENPTPRILTFATNLLIDKATTQGVDWNLVDARNLVALKQPPFPVLPFSTHKLVYHGTYSASDVQSPIGLPHLQVQDMSYRIELRPQPIQECIVETGNLLSYKLP